MLKHRPGGEGARPVHRSEGAPAKQGQTGAGGLTDEAVAVLRSLGGTEDIRGRYRVSHLLVGVKGAAPGTAIEQAGYARRTVTLGFPPGQLGMEMRGFALR